MTCKKLGKMTFFSVLIFKSRNCSQDINLAVKVHAKMVCTCYISVHAFSMETLLHLKQFPLLSPIRYGKTGEMQGQIVKVIGQEGMALN